MMTGTLGVAMWLMMALMLLGLVTGSITWARRRLTRQPTGPHARHPDETPGQVLRRRRDRPRRMPTPPARPHRRQEPGQ
jgi:hypothetical protein